MAAAMPERPPAEPCGPAKIGALDMTLPQLLKHWAESWPNKPAFIFRHPNDPDVRTVFTFQVSDWKGKAKRGVCVCVWFFFFCFFFFFFLSSSILFALFFLFSSSFSFFLVYYVI